MHVLQAPKNFQRTIGRPLCSQPTTLCAHLEEECHADKMPSSAGCSGQQQLCAIVFLQGRCTPLGWRCQFTVGWASLLPISVLG